MLFEGKVIVVTGGAAGIGKACSEAFAAEGAKVVIADVDKERANAVVRTLQDKGQTAIAVPTDISISADVARLAQAAVDAFDSIDVLVNNAGIQTYGSVITTDEEIWDRTINVNLKGLYLVSKYCIPHIKAHGGGAVVNMASVQGLASQKNVVAYTATKGAIIAMTRTMALDHAKDNIRVNAVSPGSVDTPMLRWAAEKFVPENPEVAVQDWGALHPLGRVAKAAEVAQGVVFLASEKASFITGANLVIDGGLSIGI